MKSLCFYTLRLSFLTHTFSLSLQSLYIFIFFRLRTHRTASAKVETSVGSKRPQNPKKERTQTSCQSSSPPCRWPRRMADVSVSLISIFFLLLLLRSKCLFCCCLIPSCYSSKSPYFPVYHPSPLTLCSLLFYTLQDFTPSYLFIKAELLHDNFLFIFLSIFYSTYFVFASSGDSHYTLALRRCSSASHSGDRFESAIEKVGSPFSFHSSSPPLRLNTC